MRNSDSIELHPEFGLNPCLDLCFWCGEPRGVALLGRNRANKEAEAPRQGVFFSYEPCDKCQENFSRGVLLAEVSEKPNRSLPPIQGNLIPTGRWWVVSTGFAESVFGDLNGNRAYISVDLGDKLAELVERMETPE